jgi:hypothetical protein
MLCGGVTLVQWKPAQATKVVVRDKIYTTGKNRTLLTQHLSCVPSPPVPPVPPPPGHSDERNV